MPRTRAASRHALQNLRSTVWMCLRCGLLHLKPTKAAAARGNGPGFVQVDQRPGVCVSCTSPEIEKFDSRIEADHATLLMRLQQAGAISSLAFHPKLVVPVPPAAPRGEPSQITFTADGTYLESDGRRVVYDVKAKGAPLDADFSLRRRIVESAFGLKIQIVGR